MMRARFEHRTLNDDWRARKQKQLRAEIARGKEAAGSIVRVCLSSAYSVEKLQIAMTSNSRVGALQSTIHAANRRSVY